MDDMTDVLTMQESTTTATDQALAALRAHGPMTAEELYSNCAAFEDAAHCSRALANMATRTPIRLARRKVPHPLAGRSWHPLSVFQYDLAERNFGSALPKGVTDLFTENASAVGSAPTGPAGGVPNNTGSQEGGDSFLPPDPAVGAVEASGAIEGAPDAGHDFEAPRADLDAVIGQRDALLGWLGVGDFLEAEARIQALHAGRHAALNDAAAYRLVVAAMRERLGVATDLEVPEAFDMCLHDAYQSLRETDHPLFEVFGDVVRQVTRGKGERHGGEATPFFDQPWLLIANTAGNGFLVGQGIKKAMEAGGKPDLSAWETELLGAVAYLGMAVLHGRMRRREAAAERGGVAV